MMTDFDRSTQRILFFNSDFSISAGSGLPYPIMRIPRLKDTTLVCLRIGHGEESTTLYHVIGFEEPWGDALLIPMEIPQVDLHEPEVTIWGICDLCRRAVFGEDE